MSEKSDPVGQFYIVRARMKGDPLQYYAGQDGAFVSFVLNSMPLHESPIRDKLLKFGTEEEAKQFVDDNQLDKKFSSVMVSPASPGLQAYFAQDRAKSFRAAVVPKSQSEISR